jgi:mannan endo-1,4-beta-mannosidase
VGALVREALEHAPADRPYFDSEHGPIHFFKDKKRTLPEAFDDEYFRHIQWAHLASGGAGGGMRWPNRNPHVLTPGMRRAQRSLAGFLPLIEWSTFRRRNLNDEAQATGPARTFACGDDRQAVAWLLRTDAEEASSGRLRADILPLQLGLDIPGLRDGPYVVTPWDTIAGRPGEPFRAEGRDGVLPLHGLTIASDLALAVRPA